MARRKHLKSLELCVNFDICESPERLKVLYSVQDLKACVFKRFLKQAKSVGVCPNFDMWVPTGANFCCIFIGFTKNVVFARSFLLGVFPNFHIGVPRSAGLCVSIGRLTFAEIIIPIAGRPIMTSHEDAWILLTIAGRPIMTM